MNEEQAIELGFSKIGFFTVMNSLIMPLGRNRQLNFGSIGTPNEMLFICEVSDKNKNEITNAICLHNFDYDGLMTVERLKTIIEVLTTKP